MKDLNDDPRLDGLPAKQKTILKESIANLKAEKAFDSLAQEIEDAPKTRDTLQQAIGQMGALEKALARPITVNAVMPKPAAQAAVKQAKVSSTKRLAAVILTEMSRRLDQTEPSETINRLFPGPENAMTRRKVEAHHKAATSPADTTTAGFASELVKSSTGEFFEALVQRSAAARLRELGTALDFSGFNSITIPRRDHATLGSMAAAWIEENSTIPVAAGQLASTTLNRFKLGVICVSSRELLETTNALEIFENWMLDDLAASIDNSLLDPSVNGITGVRPSAITVGAPNTPSASGGTANLAAFLEDIGYLRAQMFNARNPVIVMHTHQLNSLELIVTPEANFPLAPMIAAGSFWGMTIVHSPFVPYANIIALDASALAIGASAPSIDVREEASLVMSSASGVDPAMKAGGVTQGAVDGAGSIHESDAAGTTPASVTRSLFQTDSTAVRLIQPLTYGMMTGNSVAYVTGAQYGGLVAPTARGAK